MERCKLRNATLQKDALQSY